MAGADGVNTHNGDDGPGSGEGAVRVLVVDDDPVVREAYRSFLATREGLEQCGEATNGQAGVEAYAEVQPDVVLMDLQMPILSGIEATAAITSRWSGACVIALTTFSTSEHVIGALRAGAAGYLVKDTDGDTLAHAILQAVSGEMPLSPQVRRELVVSVVSDPLPVRPVGDPGLTPRERELLGWLAAGQTNQQIGRSMFISEGSVKQYVSHIGDKLGVKSRTQILVSAIQRGLVDLDALPTTDA